MRDGYFVNHEGLADVNAAWGSSVRRMHDILDRLNTVLHGVFNATSGQALPLWDERQKAWNKAYDDMNTRLGGGQVASLDTADIWQSGDRRSGQIMGGG